MNKYDKQWTDNFLFWMGRRFGEEQKKKLIALAESCNKDPFECVNNQTAVDFCQSEHNSNLWLEVKDELRESWR